MNVVQQLPLLLLVAVATAADVTCTLRVRFAEPPTNGNRFKPPVVVNDWHASMRDSVRSCDPFVLANMTSCPQVNDGSLWLTNIDEDCLMLNVFAPSAVSRLLPVSVFFYGGSFVSGSTSIPLYDGAAVVAKSNDTIVVTANYRLGALGFLSLSALHKESNTTGNWGLLDQIGALEWVQANIANFGGDPSRVTIFGESAGAVSVCALTVSPLADGLFSGAIMESGLCQDAYASNVTEAVSLAVTKALMCGASDLRCLRAVPWRTIVAAQLSALPSQQQMLTPWAPTIDNVVLSATPLALLQSGRAISSLRRVIIGTNTNETTVFAFPQAAARNLTESDLFGQLVGVYRKSPATAEKLIAMYLPATGIVSGPFSVTAASVAMQLMVTDSVFTCPSLLAASLFTKIGIETYTYVFARSPSCMFDNIPPALLPLLGAGHSFELPYVFNVTAWRHACTRNPIDNDLSGRISDYWQSFVRGEAPSTLLAGGLAQWPKFDSKTRQSAWLDAPTDSVAVAWRVAKCAALGIPIS